MCPARGQSGPLFGVQRALVYVGNLLTPLARNVELGAVPVMVKVEATCKVCGHLLAMHNRITAMHPGWPACMHGECLCSKYLDPCRCQKARCVEHWQTIPHDTLR